MNVDPLDLYSATCVTTLAFFFKAYQILGGASCRRMVLVRTNITKKRKENDRGHTMQLQR